MNNVVRTALQALREVADLPCVGAVEAANEQVAVGFLHDPNAHGSGELLTEDAVLPPREVAIADGGAAMEDRPRGSPLELCTVGVLHILRGVQMHQRPPEQDAVQSLTLHGSHLHRQPLRVVPIVIIPLRAERAACTIQGEVSERAEALLRLVGKPMVVNREAFA